MTATQVIGSSVFSILLMLGCDRTVSPSAAKTAGEIQQPAETIAQDNPNLVDHTPPVRSALEHDPSENVLPTADSGRSDKPVEEKVVTIQINKSDDPDRMLDYLTEIDRSIEQLLLVQKKMEIDSVRENGIKLSKMKLESAKHLSNLPRATPEHIKIGMKAQLVALSHLSGLKDVQAAKQLEAMAKELLTNPDGELKQQGRIVLFGFAVQNLQNGVISDPQQIVLASKDLVADERFRGRVEMTSLQHAMNALAQMGYREQIWQIQRITFDAFSNSPDQPLRHESWNRLVADSPAQLDFMGSLQPLGTAAFDRRNALSAAKKLLEDFPNPVTLEMLASTIPNIEYAGQAEFSSELSKLIEVEAAQYSAGVSTDVIQAILAEHKQRMNWIGRPFEMPEVVDMEGIPLAVGDLSGKVILVSFGASWDLNCMKELPFIERAYDELHASGLEVVYVSMDSDIQQLQRSVKQNAKPWKIYRSADGDLREFTRVFGITMFPHMMLVGRDGTVASLHVRGEQIATQSRRLLSK